MFRDLIVSFTRIHHTGMNGVENAYHLRKSGNYVFLYVNTFKYTQPFQLRPSSSMNCSVRPSVRLSVCLSVTPFWLCSHHHIIMNEIFRSYYQWQKWCQCKRPRSRSHRSWHNLAVSGLWYQFEFIYDDGMMHKARCCLGEDDGMMHKAWCCLGEVSFYFSRSSIKFQGHTAKNNCRFWPKLGRFQIVTPVKIHQWLRNDAQSLK